jgi:hypothetical protein
VTTALHLLQIAIVCLIVMGLVWACRFVWRRSRLAGLMLAAGLAIRVCGGAFFLAVSYFEWPLLTSLQMGNGFWTLAPDAQEYYRMGSLVADHWQLTTTRGYVGPLGYWMRAVGVNPASPVLFAIVMYTLGVVTLVMAFGRNRTRAADQALHLSVAAISFTPMLVYSAVFGLKDVFFTTLVVIMAVAYLTLLVGTAWTRTTRTTTLAVAAVGIPAVFLIAGTRAYFAILLFAAIGVTYAACVLAGVPSRRRAVAQAAVVLPALALTIVLGAEGGYPLFLRNLIVGAVGIPNVVVVHPAPIATGLEELDRRRDAIDKYGGNSMLSRRGRKTRSDSFPAAKADADSFPAAKAGADGLPAAATGSDGVPAETETAGRLKGIAVGLGAVFLPSPVIGKLAGVDLQISTVARLIADADTVMFDVMAALILWLVIVNRRETSLPPLVFGLVLAVLVAVPLAYVMTNFGTLIRLRLLVAAPLWTLMLALAPGFAARRSASVPAPSQSPAGIPARSDAR